MAVKSIMQEEFHHVIPMRSDQRIADGVEVEWFADETGRMLGAIAAGGASQDWRYILWKREKAGKFRVCELKGRFRNHEEAKVVLLSVMEVTEKAV